MKTSILVNIIQYITNNKKNICIANKSQNSLQVSFIGATLYLMN